MENKTLGFIGGGRITSIFLHGFEMANASFSEIIVFDPDKNVLTNLQAKIPEIICESENLQSSANCDIVILAIHPPIMVETLTKIKPFLKDDAILLSLAPKISIQKIKEVLGGFSNISRAIPSAPGIILQGIHPVAFSDEMSEDKKDLILEILESLGETPVVIESKLEAYALICAMGSTYFWFQLNKLQELAMKFGMDKTESKEVIAGMIEGSVNTLLFSDYTPEEVMDLIPVKPIGEFEETIKGFYEEKLTALFEKIKT